MGIKNTIQQWLGYLSLGVLGVGFLLLILNALAGAIGWLGDSKKRFISLHPDSLAKLVAFGLFALVFVFVYWFKSSEGRAIVRDQFLPVSWGFLLLLACSRMLSSGESKVYGPLDGVASLLGALLLAWPLWADYKSRPPRPRSEPDAVVPEPAAEPGAGLPGGEDSPQWSVPPSMGPVPPDPGQTAQFPTAGPPPFPTLADPSRPPQPGGGFPVPPHMQPPGDA